MLKFTYTDRGIHLEHLEQSLNELITQRVLLAIRTASSLIVEPGTASCLLPDDLPELTQLSDIRDRSDASLSFCQSDAGFIEVSLQGVWLSSGPDAHEGVFLTNLGAELESWLVSVWQASLLRQSSLIS